MINARCARWLGLAFILGSALSACASASAAAKVRPRAAFDLQCTEDKVQITAIREGYEYGARGCGKQGAYVFRDGEAVLNSPISPVDAASPTAASPADQPADQAPAR
jgi:hypothetical protein